MARLRVSVVIPMHNAAGTLERCLAGVATSLRRPDEVIVVDDASRDASGRIAEAAGAALLRLEPTPRGPAFARNAAAAKARGDVLVFVDSDVVVHPDTIERLVSPIERDPALVATFGGYDDDPPAPGIASRYANLRHHFVHQQGAGEATTFWAGCGAVRRSAYDAAGGFDARYDRPAIEDVELGLRLTRAGGRVRLVPEALATHLKRWSLANLWRTDVCRRALPWARLMASGEAPATGLNSGMSAKASALAIAWALPTALLGVVGVAVAIATRPDGRLGWIAIALLVSALVATAAWVALNARFLALLYRRGGVGLALGGGALHAAYYAYSAAAVAWVSTRARWAGLTLADAAARTLCLFAVAACGAVAVAYGAFALTDPGHWVGVAATLEGRGSPLLFGEADVISMQRRALAAAALTSATAAAVALLGSSWLATALRDAWRMATRVRRLPAWHVALLVASCLALAAMWLGYADQPMRTDEAASATRYADRSPLVALAYYHDTNNHIAHSLMLSLVGATFGDSERAMRLPALAGVLLAIPLMYVAARRMGGAVAGVLAVVALAGSGYTLDIATNARGYPFVISATLAGIALLPDVFRRRAAWLGVLAASAWGAWAVPVMLYPVGVLWAWLLLTVIAKPSQRAVRRVAMLVGLVLATGLCVTLLYLPVLVTADPERQAVVQTLANARPPTLAQMAEWTVGNLRQAWRLWTHPWPEAAALGSLALCFAGWVAAVARPGRARRLALAAVAGPVAIWLATRLTPPPWWTLGWLFPFYLLFATLPIAWALRALAHRGRARPIPPAVATGLAGLLLVLGLAATLTSPYPRGVPAYVGHPGARAVAAHLAQHAKPDDIIYCGRPVSSLLYYLRRLGVSQLRVADRRELPDEASHRVIVVLSTQRDMDDAPFTWNPRTAPGWRESARQRIDDSVIVTFQRQGDG